jgi:hypothetical protein
MIANISLPVRDGVCVSLSISTGATLAQPGEAAEELIRRADELMYRSKTSGHGCAFTELDEAECMALSRDTRERVLKDYPF